MPRRVRIPGGLTRRPPQLVQDIPEGALSPDSARYLTAIFRFLWSFINGGISYGDGVDATRTGNLDGQYLKVTAPSVADTTFPVGHGLERLPVGYRNIRPKSAAILYDAPDQQHTEETLYLRCNVANAETLIEVF